MAPYSRPPHVAADTRWLALVVLCAGMLTIVLDATIVNVALTSIRSNRGFTLVALVVAATVLRPAEGAEEGALQERDRPLGDAALPAARVR